MAGGIDTVIEKRLSHSHGAIGIADDDWQDRPFRGQVEAQPRESRRSARLLHSLARRSGSQVG